MHKKCSIGILSVLTVALKQAEWWTVCVMRTLAMKTIRRMNHVASVLQISVILKLNKKKNKHVQVVIACVKKMFDFFNRY